MYSWYLVLNGFIYVAKSNIAPNAVSRIAPIVVTEITQIPVGSTFY